MKTSSINTTQEKYVNKTKPEMIEESQDLVDKCAEYFVGQGFAVQKQADSIPYMLFGGKKKRLWDMSMLRRDVPEVKVECKDFCQCIVFPSTGLPRVYVENMIRFVDPSNLLLIFRDNNRFLTEYCSRWNIVRNKAIDMFIRRGSLFYKGEELRFMPYGEFLVNLMENRHKKAEESVLCNWSSFMGEKQYMFDIRTMKPITKIFPSHP